MEKSASAVLKCKGSKSQNIYKLLPFNI